MRLGWILAICLVWMSTATFAADSHETAMTANEALHAKHSADEISAVSRSQGGLWDRALARVWATHDQLHRALAQALRDLKGKDDIGWGLVLVSFLYGVLHAAGPGHGKAVLTTYLLTHRHRLNRGIAMGTLAALLQGLTALLLVYGLTGLAGWLPRETGWAALWASRVSFFLLLVVGLYVLVRATATLAEGLRQWRGDARDPRRDHAGHTHGDGCGCRHLPSVVEIDTAGSRGAAVGIVLAIGLRPCSGAVLVLILAAAMGLIWHGALAVLAMSLGTAITIVALAILATRAREWASRIVKHQSPLWALAGGGVGALGGTLLVLLGLSLLSASFAARQTMGL